jgi:hypothetical protein
VGWRDLDPSWEYQWNTNGIPIEIMQPMVLEYLPIHLPQKSTSFVGKYSSTSIWVYNLSIFITFYCRNQPVLHEMGTCFFSLASSAHKPIMISYRILSIAARKFTGKKTIIRQDSMGKLAARTANPDGRWVQTSHLIQAICFNPFPGE